MNDYEARCAEAATEQGLDLATEELKAAKMRGDLGDATVTVDQTGGFTMVLNVSDPDTDRWVGITSMETWSGGDATKYLVVGYMDADYEEGTILDEDVTVDELLATVGKWIPVRGEPNYDVTVLIHLNIRVPGAMVGNLSQEEMIEACRKIIYSSGQSWTDLVTLAEVV